MSKGFFEIRLLDDEEKIEVEKVLRSCSWKQDLNERLGDNVKNALRALKNLELFQRLPYSHTTGWYVIPLHAIAYQSNKAMIVALPINLERPLADGPLAIPRFRSDVVVVT